MPLQILVVKSFDRDAELLGLASNFVECGESIVNVTGSVLDPLGHDRSGKLLKLQYKMDVLLPRLWVEIFREPKEQNVA